MCPWWNQSNASKIHAFSSLNIWLGGKELLVHKHLGSSPRFNHSCTTFLYFCISGYFDSVFVSRRNDRREGGGMPSPAPLLPLPLLSFHGTGHHQLKPSPPNGAIWRLHCPYDARSTTCLTGKPNVNPRQTDLDNFWWQFLMTIFDDNFWWQFLMKNFWWQF